MNRSDVLLSLQARPPEVLIIGAGCNGAGIFRDLALNGVDVLLIDPADFGSGMLSDQLAQGGIHYFEHGKFRLARRAARERDRLIENAPHLVRPLPIVMPAFELFQGLLTAPFRFLRRSNKPAGMGALALETSLLFYDWLTQANNSLPAHKFEAREASLALYPGLSQKIEYTATYYAGQILSPERFVVELVLDGEAAGSHARALNYASLTGAQAGKLTLKDDLTGKSFELQPRLVINTSGALPLSELTHAVSSPNMPGRNGTRLVLRHPELRAAIGKRGFFLESSAGRALIFPFYDLVEITVQDNSGDEIDGLNQLLLRVFPTFRIIREQILFRSVGEQLMEYRPAKNVGQSISIDRWMDIPIYSVPAGIWTGFRADSESVTDQALVLLGKTRRADTKMLPIGGGRDYPRVGLGQIEFISKVAAETGLGDLQPKKLFYRYGTRALEIAHYLMADRDVPLVSKPDWTRREVEFLVAHEKALHVDDILVRRSCLARLGEVTQPLVVELSQIMGAFLGWTDEQKEIEMQRSLDFFTEQHGAELF